MPDVFVSYSRRDGDFVRALVADLEARGKEVWIDTQGIGDGEVFPDAIRHAIEASDGFVFVISPESVKSRYCESEVDYAVSLQKRLVPVLREPVADEALPEPVRVRNWVPFTPDADATVAADRLVSALDTDLDHVKAHTHWLVRALDWEEHDRDRSFLLRGSELAAADAWLSSVGDGVEPAPTALQREYVFSSRAAAGRRQRLVVTVSLVGLAVAVALAVLALVSRDKARSAQARATNEAVQSTSRVWASESIAQLPIDPERSILIAMAAVRKMPTTDAVFALRRALDVSPLRVRLASVGSQSTPFYWGAGISYSPDGRSVAEGSQDGSVRVFDAASGRLKRTIRVGSAAPIVQYSPDGSRLAIAGAGGVRLVDPATGTTLQRTKTSAFYAGNLAFSPDGSALFFTNNITDRPLWVSHVYRWDLRSDRVHMLARGGIRGVGGGVGGSGMFFVQVTPGGRRLLVGGIPGVALIDARSGRVIATTLRIPFTYWMALSPDGRRLAITDSPAWPSSAASGSIVLLDAGTLRRVGTVGPPLRGDAYTAVAFSPDGTRLAFGTNEGSSGVFDLQSNSLLIGFPGHTTNLYQLTFSPDGRQVATAAGDGRAFIWRAGGNQARSMQTTGIDTGTDGYINSDLAFNDAGILARFRPRAGPAAKRQVVEQWMPTGARRASFGLGPPDSFLQLTASTRFPTESYVRLSASGRFALAGPMFQGTIKHVAVWRLDRRSKLADLPFHGLYGVGCCPVISNDGRWVAYNGNDARLQLRSVVSSDIVKLGQSPCGWSYISFSSDDKRIAASDTCGHVGVWDTASHGAVGHLLHFIGFINLGPVAFSRDDRVLAVANSGNVGEVSLVDLRTGGTIRVLNADTKGVQSLSFSSDGMLLATGSLDGTARIWDAHTGRQLRILDDPAPLDNVAFSPDGRYVATLDYLGVIDIWDACSDCRDPAALLSIAAKRVTRELTPAERGTFLR
jgi:WD40 repeat protein